MNRSMARARSGLAAASIASISSRSETSAPHASARNRRRASTGWACASSKSSSIRCQCKWSMTLPLSDRVKWLYDWTLRQSSDLADLHVAANLLAKPRTRRRPRSLHGFGGDAQRLCSLLEREPREDPALHNAKGAFVNLREALERDIDREHLFDLGVAEERHVVSRSRADGAIVTATLQARTCSRVIHQNAPHRLSGNREETVAVRGGELTLLQETEVDLVDEGGGRERVTGRLAAELPAGHLTQLVVDERNQSLQRLTIACAPARKPLCDLAIGGHG